jgi:glucosamine--fructose-6-phosphate aminotransferase (isomerizing)
MRAQPDDPAMLQETRQFPEVAARQLRENRASVAELAGAIGRHPPAFAVTLARGSSDHAATFWKYALEIQLGLPTLSAAPSVVTLYRRQPRLAGALAVAISQSGASPDLIETLAAAGRAGALTVAVVNDPESELAAQAQWVLPMWAGPERAVAATKSYLASLLAATQLCAALGEDPGLRAALSGLPERAAQTLGLEALAAAHAERYRYAEVFSVLGRGLHLGIAQEAALKLKETSGLHAEAFSSAEFAHGPVRLIEPGHPVLGLLGRDATGPSTLASYRELASRGAELIAVGAEPDFPAALQLTTPAGGHPLADPLLSGLATYLLAGHVALARGMDPDAPPALHKVTKTR